MVDGVMLIVAVSLTWGLALLLLRRVDKIGPLAQAKMRQAQLRAGDPERYFEERRSLRTYPDRGWRIRGMCLTLLGLVLLALSLLR